MSDRLRALVGRAIEWFLSYEHEVVVEGSGVLPYHKYQGDAGYDLYCSEFVVVGPGCTLDVPSALFVDMRDRIWLEIKARSSTLRVKGLEVVDAVIDRDFRGELKAVIHNPTRLPVAIERGERVVQVVPHRLVPLRFRRGSLSPSPRGSNGFGSTGR